jgi:hypothetical protein
MQRYITLLFLIVAVQLQHLFGLTKFYTRPYLTNCLLIMNQEKHWSELTFHSSREYPNPPLDITLDMTLTNENGATIRIPGFWVGGQRWCVRIASSQSGTWSYQTQCSDPENSGLHGVCGTLIISPSSHPHFQHGQLKVASDCRHLAFEDGTPFFWLGDTWWMALTERLQYPEDFSLAVNDRANKGFTVIQLVAGLFPDMAAFDPRGGNAGGYAWTHDFTNINPAFFDAAEQKILSLVNHGLLPCIVGAWGYYLTWMGVEKMQAHWRYIIARWGSLPAIWCAAGEQTMPWYLSESPEQESRKLRDGWSEVIRYLRHIDQGRHLITTHPTKDGRDSVNDPSLLDFDMQQTGHKQPTPVHAWRAYQAWLKTPAMPVICGESRYEALEINPTLTARDARQAFWAHMLNSGCAGHTYGVNGLWQVNLPAQRFGPSPLGHDWGGTPWQTALGLPGSQHMQVAKSILTRLRWHDLMRSPALAKRTRTDCLIRQTKRVSMQLQRPFRAAKHLVRVWLKDSRSSKGPAWQDWEAIPSAITPDRQLALCYLFDTSAIAVELGRLAPGLQAQWIDPTTGESQLGQPLRPTGWQILISPGKNQAGDEDWLLIMSSQPNER